MLNSLEFARRPTGAQSLLADKVRLLAAATPLLVVAMGCGFGSDDFLPLTADLPLHLEKVLDNARVDVPETSAGGPESRLQWNFETSQPAWSDLLNPVGAQPPATVTRGSRRIVLTADSPRTALAPLTAGIVASLDDLDRNDSAYVVVRARTTDRIESMQVGFNVVDDAQPGAWFRFLGERSDIISDGSAQSYVFRADWSQPWQGPWQGPWREIGLLVGARAPAEVEILSVAIVPKSALYGPEPFGVRMVSRARHMRRAIFVRAPARLSYSVIIPPSGGLDVGLGVVTPDAGLRFRIEIRPAGDDPEILFEETYSDSSRWGQRSIDVSRFAGQSVDLALNVRSDAPDAVALWATPTLSGRRTTDRPNVVLYIIDGAAAEEMSVYGGPAPMPNLERLAAEGVVFERAHSNSTWTRSSNPSFMTSLHHSVLGGYRSPTDLLPSQAVTMAERMHRGGYQTATLTANPWAGSMSGLERGLDLLREDWSEFTYLENHSASSRYLHEAFWEWRGTDSGQPYWVHFQTTDAHFPWRPGSEGAIREASQRVESWRAHLEATVGDGPWWGRVEDLGSEAVEFVSLARALYHERLSYNDLQVGLLVDELTARGEWAHTLFIVASDHASWAAGVPTTGGSPPAWLGPMFADWLTRVPMIFVWPERIEGGRRIDDPVSMIDLLPTVLELTGLPNTGPMQGHSLAPLLLDAGDVTPRPVIFDEFYVNPQTGQLSGTIEVLDGRWGAVMSVNPSPARTPAGVLLERPSELLLYDRQTDPEFKMSVDAEQPDLVERYRVLLRDRWRAHQRLASSIRPGGLVPTRPDQLRRLRSLGYVR